MSNVSTIHVTDGYYSANSTNNDNGKEENSGEQMSSHLFVDILLWYQQYHGYVSLVICIFSITTNILNIIVLTRPKMRSPVNFLLSGLAAVDTAKMSSYFLFALNIFVLKRPDESSGFSKFEIIVFLLIAQNAVITLHLSSMMIAIMLAFYRYVIMRSPLQSQNVLTMRSAKLTLVAVALVAIVLCSPNYIQQTAYQINNETDSWWHKPTDFATNNAELSSGLCFYIYGLLGKVGGSICLVVLSGLLLATLHEAAESSRKVRGKQDAAKRVKEAAGQRRLTLMLIGIVLVFVVVELPQGVLLIMSMQPDFFIQVYTEMGDFLDLLTMLNSSVNFILYCSMSKQFRCIFAALFVTPCRKRLLQYLNLSNRRSTASSSTYDDTPAWNRSGSAHPLTTRSKLEDEDEQTVFLNKHAITAETNFSRCLTDSPECNACLLPPENCISNGTYSA